MLRLSRDRLLIGLAPSALSLVRVSGVLRARVAEARTIDCEPAAGEPAWQRALAVLGGAATALAGEPLDVTVVLSNHFVRYALVPWSDALDDGEEEIAYASHAFARIHGDRARSWVVRVGDEAAGDARVASAIDRGLLDALRACFPASGRARLVSVQPHLMSAFNLWRRQLAPDAWLLLVEPQRACLALRAKGRWTAVRNARGAFDDVAAWVGLLEREQHRVEGDSPGEVAVFAPGNAKAAFAHTGRWRFSGLMLPPSDGPAADASRHALALSAQ